MPPVDLPGADDVRAAAAAAAAALAPHTGADWDVPAGDLEWSARTTLEHILEGLTFYARDLATPVVALPDDELELVCKPGSSPQALVGGLEPVAAVVAAVVAASPPDVRAFHPDGMADRSGFAAMACDEVLIHTDDIARGFDAGFGPPGDVCERVVARLFPWAPADGDAWERLRWANGRTALPGRPRPAPEWSWHCAPLAEWDGTVPPAYRPQ